MADLQQQVDKPILQHYVHFKIKQSLTGLSLEVPCSLRDPYKIQIPQDTNYFRFFDRIEALYGGRILRGPKENYSGFYYFGEEVPIDKFLKEWNETFRGDLLECPPSDKEKIKTQDEIAKSQEPYIKAGRVVRCFLESHPINDGDLILAKYAGIMKNCISLEEWENQNCGLKREVSIKFEI